MFTLLQAAPWPPHHCLHALKRMQMPAVRLPNCGHRSRKTNAHAKRIDAHAADTDTAAYQVFQYTSKAFNNTYRFNNRPTSQADAEARCGDQGGHLVSYTAQSEQGEVEKYFQDQESQGCSAAGWQRLDLLARAAMSRSVQRLLRRRAVHCSSRPRRLPPPAGLPVPLLPPELLAGRHSQPLADLCLD